MRGGEYLRADVLERLWADLDEHARAEIARCAGGLSAWLAERSPLWHRVGRVSFHLAENKRDPDCPFAFLATYAPRLLDGRRVQYQPLGRALEEYAGAKDRPMLVRLLGPVERAAERCPWVRRLVDSGEVFHALRWSPDEAYRVLKDAPRLEESGLLVRLPDWWTKRPPRVRVGVSIGGSKAAAAALSAASILDFRVDLALDGETLTEAEWRHISATTLRNGLGGHASAVSVHARKHEDGRVFHKGLHKRAFRGNAIRKPWRHNELRRQTNWRRGRDSNPRSACGRHAPSKRAP
jgi:hypothetical protein